jgi:putative ABC transport system permease protein
VYLFTMIALFVLLIACINFMNLSTARSAWRAKEVGVRKALGSSRADLIRQFLGESVLYSLVSALLAVLLMEISMPYFNLITQKQLGFNLSNSVYFIPFLIGLVLFTGFLAGSYPAYYLSAFQPLQVLKGQLVRGFGRNRLRSYLVLIQYSISIILLISAFVVYKQLKFVQDKDPGYQKENVILIKRVHGLGDKLDVFKQNILSQPNILSASYSRDMPGDDFSTNSVGVAGRPLEEVNIMTLLFADYDLAQVMGLTLESGRWFSREFGTDTAVAIVNQAALRALSIQDFPNEKIVIHSTPPHPHGVFPIVGVVRDFHYESLHHGIKPMVIMMRTEGWFNRMAVRIKKGSYTESLSVLEKKWNEMETGQPFMYTSLDQNMEAFYRNDQRTQTLYTIFSMLAIFVASLGLFGLAAFTTESRTREISIRKVMGAGEKRIVLMLSVQFARWVLLANLIAWPLAWLLMDNWLNHFAYRINMPWMVFLIAALLTLLLAMLTVLYQAIKAARTNPAEALKYE